MHIEGGGNGVGMESVESHVSKLIITFKMSFFNLRPFRRQIKTLKK